MFNAGDTVVIEINREPTRVTKVTRVTSTLAIAGDRRFKRDTGQLVGSNVWTSGSIRLANKDDIAADRRRRLIYRCSNCNWRELSNDQLLAVFKIINESRVDKTGWLSEKP